MDDSLNRRRSMRRDLVLDKLSILVFKTRRGVNTVDLFNHCSKNGYYYSIKTFHLDLKLLEEDGLIVKDIEYMGKGYGTKSFWKPKI